MVTLIDTSQEPLIREICDRHQNKPDELLEILHDIQATDGYISDGALKIVADALNISRAEAHGVVSFYHDFRRTAPPQATIKICRAEACQAVGSEELAHYAEATLNTKFGDAAEGADFGLKAVYCLGNCALGPAMMIDETLYGRVTPERFDAVCEDQRTNRRQ